jgi:hypothetical protein
MVNAVDIMKGKEYNNVKVKLSLCFLTEHHPMKAYWRSGDIAPHILDPGTGWSGQLHVPTTLPPGKEPMVHIG